ncbi:MAG: DUF58 domain-containing protein [Vicinamibacterales bacterium]
MSARAAAAGPSVSLDAITRIELIVARLLQERTAGEHRSRTDGSGFDFVGLRDWQSGDRMSAIDWPQSSLTNFAPLVVREFDQPSTATVVAVADLSLSTRCGAAAGGDGSAEPALIAAGVARALAVIGLSAVFFQDRFGLIAFERDFSHLAGVAPRAGRNHVVHCLDAYLERRGLEPVMHGGSVSTTLAGSFRTTSLVPFVSDFLFDEAFEVIGELARLDAVHDVFLVLVDGAPAYTMPGVSSRWIEIEDLETGERRTVSRRTFADLGARVAEWQDRVERAARDAGLDVVRVGRDAGVDDLALSEFVAERRLRKTAR